MIAMRRDPAACLFAAFVAVLAGCNSGPISATHVEVVRYRLDGETRNRIDPQTLNVDLLTGQTTLQDADGPAYPSQLPQGTAEQWRQRIHDGSWKTVRIGPARGTGPAVHYELTIRDGDRSHGRPLHWSVPPDTKMPEPLRLFAQTFDRVDRLAHPISDRIDLFD